MILRKKVIKDERIDLILEELNSSDKVLHLGCVSHEALSSNKSNWLHAHLCEKCPDVLGVDIERKEIEKLNNQGYRVINGDCENLNLGELFDVIVAGELIEHLANPGLFLNCVKKHLKSNGHLVLTTPNPYCYWNMLSILVRGRVPVHKQHTCWYDEATLTQLLERFGFNIIKIKYSPIPSSGKGRLLSTLLIQIGLKKIGACGFVFVCQLPSAN